MGTKIVKCTCKHEYQDAVHGKGNRVANLLAPKIPGQHEYRCTVCKQVHKFGSK